MLCELEEGTVSCRAYEGYDAEYAFQRLPNIHVYEFDIMHTATMGMNVQVVLSSLPPFTHHDDLNLSPRQGSSSQRASNLGKFGVPRPVTGSHPGTAENPGVPHP